MAREIPFCSVHRFAKHCMCIASFPIKPGNEAIVCAYMYIVMDARILYDYVFV